MTTEAQKEETSKEAIHFENMQCIRGFIGLEPRGGGWGLQGIFGARKHSLRLGVSAKMSTGWERREDLPPWTARGLTLMSRNGTADLLRDQSPYDMSMTQWVQQQIGQIYQRPVVCTTATLKQIANGICHKLQIHAPRSSNPSKLAAEEDIDSSQNPVYGGSITI